MNKKLRCAIYTRKSTDEGLEKEFNTLDAQREAGEAYIKSQMHEGWQVVPKQYDDGGFTGGNMDRPALKELLSDVRAGKVNIIVVYKVDRLTRSLHDFAKIVEMLDKYEVSFVSVTQQFNTSTSMGRLTLNVLLSFAQFEREVISERVRDKLAASKKKGMWIGGHPPLGYDVKERKLHINKKEAELIRMIFDLYLKHASAYEVVERVNAEGYRNKIWKTKKGIEKGGGVFNKTVIYRILNDPLYIGKVKHKDQTYEGEHSAIISEEVWDQVHALLEKQNVHRSKLKTESGTILRGKCFDGRGRKYTTSYSVKNKHQHYRYYENKHTKHRLHGEHFEKVIFDAIHYACLQPDNLKDCFEGEYALLSEEEGVYRLQNLFARWSSMTEKERHAVAQAIIDKITILPKSTTIYIRYEAMNELLKSYKVMPSGEGAVAPKLVNEPRTLALDDVLEISLNVIFKVRGRVQQAFDPNGKPFEVFKATNRNMTLINALGKSYRWNYMIAKGEKTVSELAEEYKVSRSYVSRMMNIMQLSPNIIEAILEGRQPKQILLKDLMRTLPTSWEHQESWFWR